jgi:hypothetical protein
MKNETIVDRVVDRLKTQPLGDLIQEEDLYDIIKQAIPKAFFEKRTQIIGSGYSAKTEDREPVIVEALRDALEANVKTWVADWTVENAEVVADYWRKVMDENLMAYVNKLQDQRATADVRAALSTMLGTINEDRISKGMGAIYL